MTSIRYAGSPRQTSRWPSTLVITPKGFGFPPRSFASFAGGGGGRVIALYDFHGGLISAAASDNQGRNYEWVNPHRVIPDVREHSPLPSPRDIYRLCHASSTKLVAADVPCARVAPGVATGMALRLRYQPAHRSRGGDALPDPRASRGPTLGRDEMGGVSGARPPAPSHVSADWRRAPFSARANRHRTASAASAPIIDGTIAQC
jgi:hypothetical protein